MPPMVKSTPAPDQPVPEQLKPYASHGITLDWSDGREDAIADCPFCGREKKFRVNVISGVFRCLVCAEGTSKGGGNKITFIRLLHDMAMDQTKDHEYLAFAQSRNLLNPSTLKLWGLCVSPLTGHWLIPGYGIDGKLNNLYQYKTVEGKKRALPTPTMNHQLFGMPLWDGSKNNVIIHEGPWDGLAGLEMMRAVKWGEGGLTPCTLEQSIFMDYNVLAVPGCNVFNPSWSELLAGKNVFFIYHNDHPHLNERTQAIVPPAAYSGLKRVTGLLAGAKKVPDTISYVHWGHEPSEYHDPALKSGHDFRDEISALGDTIEVRCPGAARVYHKMVPVPTEWMVAGGSSVQKTVGIKECTTFGGLRDQWKRAMLWNAGLEKGLVCMLASCVSTMSVGEPLWFKIYGPPGSGKSTLAEAISTSEQFVFAKSTIRGFISGGRGTDDDEDNDPSMIHKVNGKTFIIKDGDTLLQSPNLHQILSEGRDIYDGVTRTNFRTGKNKEYAGIRMTWLLCGTASLRQLDSSELGARFLDCVIMDSIDHNVEDEVLLKVAKRSFKNAGTLAGVDLETHHDEDMLKAMQLTGGYVSHLRLNAQEILASVHMPDKYLLRCGHLGKYVAIMRARPSERQAEKAEREFAARLTSQLTRLAVCIAGVFNKASVDAEVMEIVNSVALDTSRGVTQQIIDLLVEKKNIDGMDAKTLGIYINRTNDETKKLLRFMRDIEAVDYVAKKVNGVTGQPKWVITPLMAKIYNRVFGTEISVD